MANRMATSQNVVPFPALPDRAVDDRFEETIDRYASILRSHIARECSRADKVRSNDVEQEALVRICRALRDGDLHSIYRIGVTTTIDAVRRVVARRDEQLGDSRLATLRLLDALPEKSRRFAELYLQGFSASDVAELLGCSELKARRTIRRAMDELRR